MTPEQAERLAHNIISTWPTGPRKHIWQRALQNLDHNTAQTIYKQLAVRQEHPPTIAGYRIACARHDNPNQPPPPNTDPDAISLGTYLARLAERATTDPNAQTEYDRWERHLKQGPTTT